jgi:NADH-quinone oxidoreductase subunit E
MLSEASRRKIEELKGRYQQPQSVVLEALWMWQDEHGWVSEEGMREVADLLGLPYHHVLGVVTFYTMYNKQPVGRHKIEVCTNVSCMLRNSDRILAHIGERFGIGPGETTPDNRFTLVEAECLGACGGAPAVQIGDEYHENVDPDALDRILKELR